MDSEFLTTGQAARLCSVTRDTVLKWIRAGRVPAQRTPGGHHRILRRDLELAVRSSEVERGKPQCDPAQVSFHYCWEYFENGDLPHLCARCSVYLSRAHRCYELARTGSQTGYHGALCESDCGDCEYFQKVAGQDLHLLILTDDPDLNSELQSSVAKARFDLVVASCEYDCSAVLNRFKPDYVIIDSALGIPFIQHIVRHLADDFRLPVLRLIVAGDERVLPEDCTSGIFARIQRPFTVDMVNACLESLRGQPRECVVS